jgi:hypothetical protein
METPVKQYDSAQIVTAREQGAVSSAAVASLTLAGCVVAIGVALQIDAVIAGRAPSSEWVANFVRVVIVSFALPFAFVAWGKLAYVRGKLEGDLYRATGWKVDLDGDGRTGGAEIAETSASSVESQTPVARAGLPEPAQVVRLVKVNTSREPMLELHDERGLAENRIREFITRGRLIGLGVVAWRREGWTQEDWEIARDMLAEFGVATPRLDGQRGNWLMGVNEALSTMKIPPSPTPQ